MACPIKLPVGTFGATTAFLSPSPPSRGGWKPDNDGGRHCREIRLTMAGKTAFDGELSDIQFPEALNDKLYDRP
jgi:hypothetical protein